MQEMVYTLAAWHVQEGRQQAFISAWKDLGEAFNSLSLPPGKGVLIQSRGHRIRKDIVYAKEIGGLPDALFPLDA